MYRPVAGSRLALTLRRLRSRFGIAAPRVAVRTHLPWRWRLLAAVAVLAGAFLLAGGIFDTGRRFAGFDRSESQSEIEALRERDDALSSEVERLRGIANAAENSQKIDKAAIEELTRQVKAREEENTRLKESLAMFESLAKSSGSPESLSITRLRVEPMGEPGHYRYRMLAAWRGSEAKREFKGNLSFHITARQASGRSTVIIVPGEKERNIGKFAVSFKNFGSLEGSLELPADAKIERIEARLLQDGLVRASQSIPL
jgi:hypothetical protein